MVIVVEAGGNLVRGRSAVSLGNVLGQPGDPQAWLADDRPIVRLDLALDQAKQRAFPLAVAAHQADPLAGLDLEIDLVKQFRPAKGQADFAEAQKRHEVTRTEKE